MRMLSRFCEAPDAEVAVRRGTERVGDELSLSTHMS